METENNLKPLLIAINAEKKAIEYYSRAAKRVVNQQGKDALNKIKAQEERHCRELVKKFKKLAGHEPGAAEIEGVGAAISALTEEHIPDKEASDLEVCQVALADEQAAHAFYVNSAEKATDEETKKIFLDLAQEESQHAKTVTHICRILSR
ncbi:MAG: ferritin family protein [Candidatus Margulisbacteria bacterium]|nr:ferritin family protein [Candidatus Margulisiibacteriota bacterium]MBU1617319.1 ferritin family protein [Candidatus Margulisiibacteriota bacterium]MBU1867321.1 ferritin family protein [Candidatus Margulisiibacteriota bacterium]